MPAVELNSLIESAPGVSGGRPCVAGSGMPVIQIAVHYRRGESAADIHDRYPHLPLAGIHAAIAYYLSNQESCDQDLRAEAELFNELQALQQRS